MKILVLMRGLPGSGKSTFVKRMDWEDYAIEPDRVRMMFSSLRLTVDGKYVIDGAEDANVWETVEKMVETRMSRGSFVVVDATCIKRKDLNRYKALAEKYQYRVCVVDFTGESVEECKRRNKHRPDFRVVPDDTIDRMAASLKTETVPSGFNVYKPWEAEEIGWGVVDFSSYKAINHIGDVHACYTALNKFLTEHGGIKDDELYIFCGDYLDRGVETVETMKFMMELADKPNVILLEGNHEKHLKTYAGLFEGEYPEVFEKYTKPRLEAAGITPKEIRRFLRKTIPAAYYTYGDKTVVVTHGGLSGLPDMFTMAEDCIKGAGRHSESSVVDTTFYDKTGSDCYSIHGHRNMSVDPIRVNSRVFNLEGFVEMGGCLRVARLTQEGFETFEIPNDVINPAEWGQFSVVTDIPKNIEKAVPVLRMNPDITEKKMGNISSFNFSKTAFEKGTWNAMTIKCRGLFINTATNKIVCRGYDKFFNLGENRYASEDYLKENLRFPVTAYLKENGFLGLLGYDEESDELVFASKSRIDGDFAGYFKALFMKQGYDISAIKSYLAAENKCMAFEVVDIENDPHIIEYPESKIVLLDVFDRTLETRHLPYDELVGISEQFGMTVKSKMLEIFSWKSFEEWMACVKTSNDIPFEGWVLEDANGYMFKYKTPFYRRWKYCRTLTALAYADPHKKSRTEIEDDVIELYFGWVKMRYWKHRPDTPENIIDLRKEFMEFYRSAKK